VLVGLGTFGWIAVAVRCPQCSSYLGLWFMKHRSPLSWFTQFTELEQCPKCGYRPPR
jgi:DNA-directed RNA polymerase subunit RPC12/RpoP